MMSKLTSMISAMAKKGKKKRKREVQKLENIWGQKELSWYNKKHFWWFFKSFILMAKIEIVNTSFNCHNKILYIKNLIYI